jgi:AbrB family looped-hinge helix DNA binding protein
MNRPTEELDSMTTVTVSSKYRVVIPKEVRDLLGIRPGQKVEVFWDGSSLRLEAPESGKVSAREGKSSGPAASGHPQAKP